MRYTIIKQFNIQLRKVTRAEFSFDGKFMAITEKKNINLYRFHDVSCWLSIPTPSNQYKVFFTPNDKLLAVYTQKSFELWDIYEKRVVLLDQGEYGLFGVVFSHDGKYMGFCEKVECTINIWRLDPLLRYMYCVECESKPSTMSFAVESDYIAYATKLEGRQLINIVDPTDDNLLSTIVIKKKGRGMGRVFFLKNDKFIGIFYGMGQISIYKIETRECLLDIDAVDLLGQENTLLLGSPQIHTSDTMSLVLGIISTRNSVCLLSDPSLWSTLLYILIYYCRRTHRIISGNRLAATDNGGWAIWDLKPIDLDCGLYEITFS